MLIYQRVTYQYSTSHISTMSKMAGKNAKTPRGRSPCATKGGALGRRSLLILYHHPASHRWIVLWKIFRLDHHRLPLSAVHLKASAQMECNDTFAGMLHYHLWIVDFADRWMALQNLRPWALDLQNLRPWTPHIIPHSCFSCSSLSGKPYESHAPFANAYRASHPERLIDSRGSSQRHASTAASAHFVPSSQGQRSWCESRRAFFRGSTLARRISRASILKV